MNKKFCAMKPKEENEDIDKRFKHRRSMQLET
jgi:hypothetical protein